MVVDPEALSFLQLDDFTEIILVSAPSFWQDPELTQIDFCELPSVGRLDWFVHWSDLTHKIFWSLALPWVALLAHPSETNTQFKFWILSLLLWTAPSSNTNTLFSHPKSPTELHLTAALLFSPTVKFSHPLNPTNLQLILCLLSPNDELEHPRSPTELQFIFSVRLAVIAKGYISTRRNEITIQILFIIVVKRKIRTKDQVSPFTNNRLFVIITKFKITTVSKLIYIRTI